LNRYPITYRDDFNGTNLVERNYQNTEMPIQDTKCCER